MDDLEEQAWFIFAISTTARVYVPATSYETAVSKLIALHYKGAPVGGYDFVATRFCSRQDLVKSLLRPRGT